MRARSPHSAALLGALDRTGSGELVRRAGEGSPEAWNELVRRFNRTVERVALRHGLSSHDAADVAQSTWMRLLKHHDGIRDPERVVGWLVATARRESLALLRRRGRVVLSPIPEAGRDDFFGTSPGADLPALDREYGDASLERALGTLPPSYRRLVEYLSSDACPSYAQVSEDLGIPVGSIGPTKMRAMGRLRKELNRSAGNFGELAGVNA